MPLLNRKLRRCQLHGTLGVSSNYERRPDVQPVSARPAAAGPIRYIGELSSMATRSLPTGPGRVAVRATAALTTRPAGRRRDPRGPHLPWPRHFRWDRLSARHHPHEPSWTRALYRSVNVSRRSMEDRAGGLYGVFVAAGRYRFDDLPIDDQRHRDRRVVRNAQRVTRNARRRLRAAR